MAQSSKKIWNGVIKKARRIRIRRSWSLNPKTRVKKSKKAYSRKDKKRVIRDEVKIWSSQR